MLTLKHHHRQDAGFTLPEILITIAILGAALIMIFPAITSSINNYFSLNYKNQQYSSVAAHSQRLANVIRGLTDINSAGANEMDMYAYFYPNDAYVSRIRYYLNADQTKLLADVTPMTSNPPLGTPITANLKTYTIIDNFYKVSSINLFRYYGQTNNELTVPISDLDAIKNVQINLAVRERVGSDPGSQQSSLTVSLRNRKTNL